MIDLFMYVYTELKKIHPRTYKRVPQTAEFPYVVYSIPAFTEDYNVERNTLSIDIWDNIEDTTRLEQLTTIIQNAFKNKIGCTDDFSVKIDIGAPLRQEIPDPDPILNRRRLNFILRIVRRK